MRNTVARFALSFVAAIGFLSASGCASSIDPKLVYGTYGVTVAAFGKTDPDIVVASQGGDVDLILNFNYGIITDYNAVNATGLRVVFDGDDIRLDKQPIRVTHSSGEIVGTVIGKGTVDGSKVSMTLSVTPTSGTTAPAGGTIDYVVTGNHQ